MSAPFSSLVVGEGSLAAECAAVLLEGGHAVLGIMSAHPRVVRWAREHGVRVVPPADDVAGAIGAALADQGADTVDWLFSVVNPRILGGDVLALARQGTANYHDAPLPRYAGMHATSWAILNGERRHGISWHRVTARVDAGEILQQTAVDVAPTDTALALNTKCYAAAIEGFRALTRDIATGRVAGRAQDAARRTFYGRLRRPPAASVVCWDRPARELVDLARGLEFGPVANPLGRARVLFAGGAALAPRLEALDDSAEVLPATVVPGTVVRADADAIVVRATDRLVAVRELRTLDGALLPLDAAARRHGILPGTRLPVLDADALAQLEARDAASRRGEDAWVERLERLTPLALPYVQAGTATDVDVGRQRIAASVPPSLRAAVAALDPTRAPGELLLAACAAAWARTADPDAADVGVLAPPTVDTLGVGQFLFADALPVSVAADPTAPLAGAARAFLARADEAAARGPLLRDVVCRYPALAPLAGRADGLALPVTLGIADAPGTAPDARGALAVYADRDATAWAWSFDPARLDAADVARMMTHVETLAAGAAADPSCPLGRLPLLGDAERRLVVEEWNRTDQAWPREQTISGLVAAQAARTPAAIALVHGTTEVRYDDLDGRANRLAHGLRALGVGPEVRVGVCLTRTPALVVALLAVLKAGGAYVPLDPTYPADRLAFMLEDSGAPVVVTEEAFAGAVAGDGRRLIVVDRAADREALGRMPAGPVTPAPRAADLAYLIYTSGSTGRPKGVMIEHRSAVAFVAWAHGVFTPAELAGVLAGTSVCFDLSVFELFVTLAAGGSVILADNALALPDLPAAGRVTLVNTVPSAMAELVRAGALPPSVRTVNLAGEPLHTALVDRIYALGTVERVYDLYGPSEDTTYSTYTLRRPGARATIGRPVANTRAYVLDPLDQPVPVGAPGELYLGGAGLARGYHARPELTAERFVPDPFDGPSDARLYRTGDRVRWLADGTLEYLGRLDFQVKVRGFRVEPGEIEARLLAHPRVRDAVVVARDDAGERRLAAYLVATDDGPVSAGELRDHLLAMLPDYMVPAAFVWLAALPRSSNGKVDRRALPAPAFDRAALARPFAAPRTPQEIALAGIWARVLRVAQVGVDDDFFELGGDSILVIQVVSQARRAGLAFAARDVFQQPTVAALAKLATRVEPDLAAGRAAGAPAADRPVDESTALGPAALAQFTARGYDVEDAYPLSSMQQGLLFHALSGADGGAYHLQVRFAADGPLDVGAFRRVWDEVVRRHGILRTAFVWEGVPWPLQVVVARAAMPWDDEDWRDLDRDEQAARLDGLLADDRRASFDLARAPLTRVTLVRTGDARYEVVWSVHHLLLDGWSAHALLREVRERYEALAAGRPAPDEFARPYRDYIDALAAAPDADASAKAFWRGRLAGFTTPTPLGVDRRGADAGACGHARHDVTLGTGRTAALQAFAREHRVTLNTVFQGAWAVLLSRYAGDDDVLFGATVTTRPAALEGVERMVGLFLNTVPVRVRVAPDANVAEWLQALQRDQAEARAHEATPLADVQRWSEVPAGTALFDSLLVFENYPGGRPFAPRPGDPSAVSFDALDIVEHTHYPLTLAVVPGARLTVRAMYDASRFAPDVVDRLLGHLGAVLDGMLAGAHARVGALDVLPAAERRMLLKEWSATALPDIGARTVHELFAATASERPAAVALATDGGDVMYAELDRHADRIARALRDRGVGPGTFVALALRPSPDLIAAVLGVLKAGAAYVPLDLSAPAERVAFLLEDTSAPIVLAERDLAPHIPARDGTAVVVLGDMMTGEEVPAVPLGIAAVDAESPAYVMYTSGSTGRPKGVVVPHRAVVRLVRETNFMRLGPDEVFLLLSPTAFDASTLEIWGALLNGGTLAIPGPGAPPVERLGALVRRHGVTALWLTAALFRHVVDTDLDALRPLRQLLAGGDVLPPEQVRRVRRELPHVRLINGYGPTENTTFTCCHAVNADDADAGSVPVGRPIANTTVYILDAERRPVPVGVPGELWAGGRGVALGYLNRPGLTSERFVDSPFRAGERLYRTGDRTRWRADGVVEFLGRFDTQVKLRGFRVEPGEVEAVLASHPALLAAAVVVREGRAGDKRLVAYHVARDGADVDATALRAYLAERLPEYMVPSAFVRMDALPVTTNGKVDRKALPDPSAGADEARTAYEAPRTDVEAALAAIWRDVLRVERVGVHDHYYELGGDSILSIQIAARARAAGLKVGVAMLAKHPTVAGLAATLGRDAAPAAADAEMSVGTAPLTPIQRWFFELDPAERDHWNQTFLFRTEGALDARALRGAVHELLRHHDALRLRFTQADGEWTQRFAAPDAADAVPVQVEDLAAVPDEGLSDAIARVAAAAARSLDIAHGPCVRVVDMPLGRGRGGRLLVVIHHLVVDGISWRILLEDLEAAYARLLAGAAPALPAKTTSYQQWAADLSAQATSAALAAERPHWLAVTDAPPVPLPTDGPRDASNTVGEAGTVVVALDAQETAQLLQRVPPVYATQVNDVLLLALADALAPWAGRGAADDAALLLDLEGHGREDVVPDLDLTRTVGWFTSVFPVRLPLGSAGGVGERLKAMKEMLRAVPRRGVGYGSLRYLAGDAALAARPAASILFNYLGQFDQLVADSALFRFAPEDPGPWLSPRGRRRHLIEINSLVLNGRLEFRWTFGRRIHDEATVRGLADATLAALRAVIAHCRTPDAGGRTPSDYPLVRLTQAQVDRLVGDGRHVDDVGPLAPMQAAFLTVGAGATDVGFEQWRFTIDGALDADAFARAWDFIATRHEILRTAFVATGLPAPVQVIRRDVAAPLARHDWRDLDAATQALRLDALLAADRARGFRADEAPLFRLTLVRTGERAWTFVWSTHHLLLDRWSWPIVLREVGVAYEAFRAGRRPDLPPAPAWRGYLAWLAARDGRDTEAFWRAELAGIAPTPLPRLRRADADATPPNGEQRLDLTPDESARLAAIAREYRVSLNTLVTAAWGIWLGHATGRTDVTVGLTVSGRSDEVPGVERLVGMCINNLPARLRLDPEESLASLLARVDARQTAAGRHADATPADLQRWSGLPWHQRLFDTLVVFQDAAADEGTVTWLGPAASTRMAAAETRTNYPLALVVGGREVLTLRLAYHGRYSDASAAADVLAQLRAVLVALPALGNAPLRRLLDALPPAEALAPDPSPDGGRPLARLTPPRSDTEHVIARIWAELLGRDAVGVDDNFFDLGGQSLVATQIMSRVRDGFQTDLPVSLIFEHPTVEAFARAVTAREASPGRAERVAAIIRRVDEMSLQDLREVGIRA
ncbi:hypothetical protein tb265_44400 [Gemmatimonadetes bacterium T265]|nr:hypothetical protein tb265_44400 [Gemmatimonadetes bacterium T265]